ncbi:MAG: translation initiation factor 2 [Oscillospiraceae bacterium]|nr:translation initiation factor 2 [Oscillospiraceae bacterium]
MVKGVSKQVVVVKPPQAGLFEEAIFILKEDAARRVDAEELLKEACEVANRYVSQNCERKLRPLPPPFFAAAGALLTGAAWLITAILR